jgi:Ca2+-binding EF-hand superfamily protein
LKRTLFAEKAFTIMDEVCFLRFFHGMIVAKDIHARARNNYWLVLENYLLLLLIFSPSLCLPSYHFLKDGSGEVDFQEFVIAIWNYCSFSQPALITFAFDLYDNDSSGNIDVSEGQRMLREVRWQGLWLNCGTPSCDVHTWLIVCVGFHIYRMPLSNFICFPTYFSTLWLPQVFGNGWENDTLSMKVYSKLEALGKDNGGEIAFPEFKDFSRRHPALLFPAFEMQRKMQTLIMGPRFWETVAKGREKQARKDKDGEAGWKDVFEMLAEVRREEGGEGGVSDNFSDDQILQAKNDLSAEKNRLVGTIAQRREAKNITVDHKKQETRYNNRAKGIYIDKEPEKVKTKQKGKLHSQTTKKKLDIAKRCVKCELSAYLMHSSSCLFNAWPM